MNFNLINSPGRHRVRFPGCFQVLLALSYGVSNPVFSNRRNASLFWLHTVPKRRRRRIKKNSHEHCNYNRTTFLLLRLLTLHEQRAVSWWSEAERWQNGASTREPNVGNGIPRCPHTSTMLAVFYVAILQRILMIKCVFMCALFCTPNTHLLHVGFVSPVHYCHLAVRLSCSLLGGRDEIRGLILAEVLVSW